MVEIAIAVPIAAKPVLMLMVTCVLFDQVEFERLLGYNPDHARVAWHEWLAVLCAMEQQRSLDLCAWCLPGLTFMAARL